MKLFISLDNTELAQQLFNTQILGMSTSKKYQHHVNKILKQCTPKGDKYPERQQVLLKVIELIGEPNTSKERFIVAKAYAWSRADYRKQAIKYLNLYLNNELYNEAINTNNFPSSQALQYHLSEMYGYLGKAYIGEYEFEKALSTYEYIINKFPNDSFAYIGKCEVLIKQNKLLECRDWLLQSQKLPFYKLNKTNGKTEEENHFHFTLNRLLKDVENKINKGYIYRPRKKE